MRPSIAAQRALPLRRRLPCGTLTLNVYRFTHTPTSAANNHLRRIFDDYSYFSGFNSNFPKAGLFGNSYLKTPKGLLEFSSDSLNRAKLLVNDLLGTAHTEEGKLSYIRRLDQLSDVLCRVIDVAEFIRVAHPQKQWIDAAQQTHEVMFEYMNQLNTNVELYTHLRDILADPEVCDQLTEEEIQVGEYLKQDFERSGIHMDPETRENFVTITQQISVLGSMFNSNVGELAEYSIQVPLFEVKQLEPSLEQDIMAYQSRFASKPSQGHVHIPLVGNIPYRILSMCPSEGLRKRVWIALHNSKPDQIKTLNSIIQYRAYLAHMLGFPSFAAYQLEHKMARSPENVMTFLRNLQSKLVGSSVGNNSQLGGVMHELRNLYSHKEGSRVLASNGEVMDSVKPWDRDYLVRQQQNQPEEPLPSISPYLSVGTVISGLSRLFESIYNVEFIPVPTNRGETWDSQVRKIAVYDRASQKTIGYLYLDFWSQKVLPSHFTIVCSRKLNADLDDDVSGQVFTDDSQNYQLPVISLVCNFASSPKAVTLLTLDQVDTIFHEMGHAMHSMIGRTDLHNLSGTRCSTDFVELPSVLMESFARDPRVLCTIARHYQTDEPLPAELLEKQQNDKVILNNCEEFMQSKMAMLDQLLHDGDVIKNLENFDSTPIYHELERRLRIFADVESTWHGKFPHLFSYGSVYYSYLLDRAIADRVWKELFADDPWSREAGERYKNSILKWGGTRDPWKCLADALDDPELVAGDSHAMEKIVAH
ncbi:hypothetical protein DIURU_003400 [Diutina rugosa]|uniref:Mitochondrial intermediate peptidase n=1 Tax=Diutina rugosa TaxID=5481 RepID=A0A642UKU9_DIURU|nr:uncharacterized protein DIURU_003400 [Diutina rugosa]KAA8901030.1 hypothetical protein DIURU_003400 [Diutina rugosa]